MLAVPRASEGGNYAGVDTRDCEELGLEQVTKKYLNHLLLMSILIIYSSVINTRKIANIHSTSM